MKITSPFALVLAFSAAPAAWAPDRAPSHSDSRPLALVYKGPGACDDGCWQAAELLAQLSGFQTRYVGPTETSAEIFRNAKVWIQPGGQSSDVRKAMLPELFGNIQAFVARGGGYVGFCAGGFFATAQFHDDPPEFGLGLVPGHAHLYTVVNDDAHIIPMKWEGQSRYFYWEGGPYWDPSSIAQGVEEIATYPDNTVSSLRTHYGLGKVWVTGFHPEAPQDWRGQDLQDPDGLDYQYAEEIIRWAAEK